MGCLGWDEGPSTIDVEILARSLIFNIQNRTGESYDSFSHQHVNRVIKRHWCMDTFLWLEVAEALRLGVPK